MQLALKIILYLNVLYYAYSYNLLTSEQWSSISKIIQNPKTNIKQKTLINQIIYNSYESYAVKKAYDFRSIHRYKCKNINTQDLVFSSKIGLYKSILKYNGKNSFANFAVIYIKSELYKLLTETYSLSGVEKKYRKKNKLNFTQEEWSNYKNKFNTQLIEFKNNWMFDKYYTKNSHQNNFILDKIELTNKYDLVWKIVNNNLDPFSKMVFSCKYDYFLKNLASNKNIANRMICSEETIRKNLIKTHKIITKQIIEQANI
uniref:Uncharacterized protein n=1 Tax=viral metagenome TaxID=1070528 RepID=A0A6C0ES40_9ZZZZ